MVLLRNYDEDEDEEEVVQVISHKLPPERHQFSDEDIKMIALTRKFFQLCIQSFSQSFPNGENPWSLLRYFTAVIGIDIAVGQFCGPQNYTRIMVRIL